MPNLKSAATLLGRTVPPPLSLALYFTDGWQKWEDVERAAEKNELVHLGQNSFIHS